MANTIITKNSATATAAPTAGQLVQGELAVNVTDKRLFTENSGGTVVELGTNPSQLNFADNAKANFGAGSDLQIYHDGAKSVIEDQGTGNLVIRGSSQLILESSSGANYLLANDGSDVKLYYNTSVKFATIDTGIDVTGDVVASGDISANGGDVDITGAQPRINLHENDTTDLDVTLRLNAGDFIIETRSDAGTALGDRIRAASNGDISFFEDTGTTAKMVWDASDESLLLSKSGGLGLQVGANDGSLAGAEFRYSTIPAYITSSVASGPITGHATFSLNQYDNTEGTADSWSSRSNGAYNSAAVQLISTTGGSAIRFFTEANEAGIDQKMVITSAGNVGIGTASPKTTLTVQNGGVTGLSETTFAWQHYQQAASAYTATAIQSVISGASASLTFSTAANWTNGNATEHMRITSAGSVGIGTSSMTRFFNLYDTTANAQTAYFKSTNASGGAGLIAYNNTGQAATFQLNGSSNTAYGGANSVNIGSLTNNPVVFIVNNTERVRIDSGGGVRINNTANATFAAQLNTQFTTAQNCGLYLKVTNTSSSQSMIIFGNTTGDGVGSITTNGSSTSYNTSSDYRLKEGWVAVADASTRVNALKPINFAWIANGARVDGFLAHELAGVVPEAVTGEKDAVDAEGNPVYQGIDQSKLVPLLTAALQEALAEINALKARLDAANI